MDKDDTTRLQRALGVAPDGILGRNTLRALFARFGAAPGLAGELALAGLVHMDAAGILASPRRLSHFMPQVAHESGGFRYMEEIWGPTKAQRRYEGRADLGNTVVGDGFRYKGRGPLQVTGRANYRRLGCKIGVDLEQHPELAAIPSVGLWIGCIYWTEHAINGLADADDVEAVTRAINGGLNGFDDRKALLAKARGLFA